ncbi:MULTISPECIES: LysR family transcriptional regulator [unclassified Acinetobacter]|uniref:LysR family transcriptional regulator n=1 Tax=unclassified Acinetobacter TaxID=196816 RepID=UPI00244D766B|nr:MULTISPECIES: LysR family transcriptional regulator [unclassified Acinetobacter]MDH0030628.1 LysR family transcriptional regulator [Acinetobacter sp. GD04021]MDH0886261.1 LysR family transcriptional regulator [Acinetobacter sp. GD03873]MDH1081764.1 LysR family transcriptional regulator [Acinetobacter sp. GD03983]MDH2189738.1 LysR family transcriptional regulator [Acinetobacter sp. GD03645]MDH2202730.1 LysR family transcriptional regulator [Acinetobacter sp. GD03647]
MDIHKLNAFVAVVEESNISRAAVRLHMQQPPLTRLIKSLEEELDTTLLKRLPRGVEVTEAGKVLYQEAITILAHAQSIPKRVKNIAQGLEGQLNIGFTNSAGLHPFLPAVLRQFREQFPAIAIHLEEDSSSALTDAVINEKLDIVFLRKPASIHAEVQSLHVLDEPLIVALPNNHPLVSREGAIRLVDLEPYEFVLYRRLAGQDLFDNILANCYQAGFNPNIVQEAPRLTSSLNLIAAGIGLSIVPDSIQDFWNKQIVYRTLEAKKPCIAPIYAIYRAKENNIRIEHFLNLLKESQKSQTA